MFVYDENKGTPLGLYPAFFPTDIHFFHTARHVYRSVWPAREAKPRFGVMLVRSAHDCESRF